MGTIYLSAKLTGSPVAAWDVLERYTRSENHIFSVAVGERADGEYRVVTTADGGEVWERNVSVDPEHMRASYTIPGVPGAEHHHASMQIVDGGDGTYTLVWVTDMLPHQLAEAMAPMYDGLFADLVHAVQQG